MTVGTSLDLVQELLLLLRRALPTHLCLDGLSFPAFAEEVGDVAELWKVGFPVVHGVLMTL